MGSNFANKKKRRWRPRRMPRPKFTHDAPPNMAPNVMQNMSLFPGNFVAAPSVPMNTNEILDRFNQLLDWRLPGVDGQPSHPDQGDNVGYADTDDRYNSPQILPRGNSSQRLKRKIDPGDLRNRLDQHNKWKNLDGADYRESYDRPRISDMDERGELWDKRAGGERLNDCWPDPYGGEVVQSRNDERADAIIVERDLDDRFLKVPDKTSVDYWHKSFPEQVNQSERNERCWTDDRSHVLQDRDRWADDPQDFSREVTEYWLDRNTSNIEKSSYINDERWRSYSTERGFRNEYDEGRDNRGQELNFRGDPQLLAREREDYNLRENFYSGRDLSSMHREHETPSAQYRDRYQGLDSRKEMLGVRDHYSYDNYVPSGPMRGGNERSSPEGRWFRNQPLDNDNLMVMIYKSDYNRITHAQADTIRSMLIDLVMNHGNPDQMPEFKHSGLKRGGKVFYVLCRTKESMDWLLKQTLPPLNKDQLILRRNSNFKTVKISAFAPKCTRTRDEIFKLIKLQNGKKGFDFDKWTMRSYQINPSGVYMAFDISLEDARILNDLGCFLSFELKTLLFKIAINSVQ